MEDNKGFTLIELMVSISIIAILTALATISFAGAQKKARDARRAQDMKIMQLAAEEYILHNGVYPGTTAVPWTAVGQNVLEAIPKDPKTGSTYNYNIGTTNYCICAGMENPQYGNSSANTCVFTGGTGAYFCVKHQQ